MDFLNNIDLKNSSKIINLLTPSNDYDASTKKYVDDSIVTSEAKQKILPNVLDIQTDNTLDPGATPTIGDRYIITDIANLHANFGTITDVANGDIVEYESGGFVVSFDASVLGNGYEAFSTVQKKYYQVIDGVWTALENSAISAGDGILDTSGVFSVDYDDVYVTKDGSNKITVKDASIDKTKLNYTSFVGSGLQKNTSDDTLEIKINANSTTYLSADADGLQLSGTFLKKYASTLTSGETSYTVTHNLATTDVLVSIIGADNKVATADVTVVDANNVTITFSVATTQNFRVVVIG